MASAPPRSLANDIAPLTRAPTTARPHVPPSSTPGTDANSPSNAAIAPASAPAPRTASSQHSAKSHAMDRSAFRPFTDFTTHRTSGVSSDGVPALAVTRLSILRNAPSKDVTHSPRPTHSRVMFTTPNIASNNAYAIPRIDDVSLVPPGKLRRAADSRASATSAAAPATHALDSAGSDPGCPRVRYHGRHPARSIATGADNSSEPPHAVRTSLACSADLNPTPTALSSERSACRRNGRRDRNARRAGAAARAAAESGPWPRMAEMAARTAGGAPVGCARRARLRGCRGPTHSASRLRVGFVR